MLGLTELLDRKPAQLSGGQRQRVAMGRAIVREPRAFLMDEPLSNLDAKLRVGMRASLAELHARLGVTTIYVTHDQTEAMTLGQRVAVMRDGRIVQVDEPQALYAQAAGRVRRRVHRLSVDEPRRGRRRRRLGPHRHARDPARPGQTAREGRPRGARHPARGVRGRRVRRPEPPAGSTFRWTCSSSSAPTRTRASGSTRGGPRSTSGATPTTPRCSPEQTTLFTARIDPRSDRAAGCGPGARRRPGRVPLLRRRDGRRARAPSPRRRPTPSRCRWHPRRTGLDHEAHRDEAERDAQPGARPDRAARRGGGDSLRAPAVDEPRRLAPHGPRGARRARARRAAGAPSRERHVRQRAEDRAGADDDVLHRGHAAARHDPGVAHARSPGDACRAPISAGCCTSRPPSRW